MSGLTDHEAALAAGISRLTRSASFAEALAEREVGGAVRLDSKTTSVSSEPRLAGAVFRVWNGNRWVEAATSSFEPAAVTATVESLEQAAAKATGRAPPPGPSSTTRKEWRSRVTRPMRDVPVEEMLSLARDARKWASGVPSIQNVQVAIGWGDNERFYLNSTGARCLSQVSRTRATLVAIAMEGGRAEFDFYGRGRVGGWETTDFLNEATARRVAEGARESLGAAAPPTGQMAVVLDPSVSGTFAHESFGHGTEADQFVRDRSYLKPILGSSVAPESLSIIDDGSYPGGWGTIYCDDEGNPGQKTMLVDRGRFVGALHDRETAQAFRAKPTGNTRRADFLSRAFVRMTNTYVAPGDRSLEELIQEVKDGILLERATSGVEDPLGGQMQLKVKRGRLIEHGKLGRLVGSMALSGKVLDVMRSIRGVEKGPMEEIEPGYCGKGHTDLLPAGTGGVHLLSTAIVGPA